MGATIRIRAEPPPAASSPRHQRTRTATQRSSMPASSPGVVLVVGFVLASALACSAQAAGSNDAEAPATCDELASVPLEQRCSFVRQTCPSESLLPYSEWYHCYVAHQNVLLRFLYVAFVAALLPLCFCLLGDTAELYFSPTMALVAQSVPKMRPRFAGVTFVALGNGAPDLSSNISAIRGGEVLLSAGALTGGAMFVQCIVAAELVSIGKGAKAAGATMRDVGVYCVAILSVLLAFGLGQVGRAFVSWAVTLYVLYVAWVYVGDEWHARGRPKPNIQGLQQRLLAFTESFGGRRERGDALTWLPSDGAQAHLLPWTELAESSVTSSAAGQQSDAMGWVAEQPDSPATRQPRLQLDRRLLRSAPNLGAPAAAFAAHQQQPPLFTANSGPPTHQLQQQARPARSEGGGGGGGHAPHVMHLPGGQVYMDARTYQELVWADLADDVEAEQAIEQRMSAGGASAGGAYQPPTDPELPSPQPMHPESAGAGTTGVQDAGPSSAGAATSRLESEGVFAWPPDWPQLWTVVRRELTIGNSDEWDEAHFLIRSFRQVTFPMLLPAYVALRLSIPLASPGSYNRDWMTVSLMCSPLAVVLYMGWLSVSGIAAAMSLGATAAGLLWWSTRLHPDQLPELSVFGGTALAPALLAILGFVVGVMWIDAIAGEVVGALSFLAGLANFPTGILGLTLLAWGNSLGDFFSNRAMARNGHASTALTACFAAPLFNMLMSLSVGFGTVLASTEATTISVHLTPEVALGCVFLAVYNIVIIVVGRLCGERLPPWFAVFARCWYALYFVLACVSGILQHYGKL